MKLVALALFFAISAAPFARADDAFWTQAFPEPPAPGRNQTAQKIWAGQEELGALAANYAFSLREARLRAQMDRDQLSKLIEARAKWQLVDEDPFVAGYFSERENLAQVAREARRAWRRGQRAARLGDPTATAKLPQLEAELEIATRAFVNGAEEKLGGVIEAMDLRQESIKRALTAGTAEDRDLVLAFERARASGAELGGLQNLKLLGLGLLVGDGAARLAAIRHQRDPGFLPSVSLVDAVYDKLLGRTEAK